MNKLFLVLAIALFSCAGNSQTTNKRNSKFQYDTKSMCVFGNVKTIREYDYQQFVPDSLLYSYVSNMDYEFDPNGYIVLETTKLIHLGPYYYKYNYDKENNIIEILSKHDGEQEFKLLSKYALNSEGLVIEETQAVTGLSGVSGYSTTVYKYDKLNNVINKDNSYLLHHDNFKYVNTYDKNDRLIKAIEKSLDGERDKVVVSYKYSNNKLIEKTIHYEPTDYNVKTIEKYDLNGRLINVCKREHNGTVDLRKYSYDKYNNITQEMVFIDERLKYTYSHIYKYKYDQQKNWISKVTFFIDNKLVSAVKRRITYY